MQHTQLSVSVHHSIIWLDDFGFEFHFQEIAGLYNMENILYDKFKIVKPWCALA